MTDREDEGHIVGANGPAGEAEVYRRYGESMERAATAFRNAGMSAEQAADAVQRLGRLLPPIPERSGPFADLVAAWADYRNALLLDTAPGRVFLRMVDWIDGKRWRVVAAAVFFYALLSFMMIGPYLL